MMEENLYLTREGYERLTEELEQLKTVKRREIAKEIAKARAFGDLRENAEYDAAKNHQAHNEQRIAEMEFKLSGAKIIDHSAMALDEVLIGATIKIRDLTSAEEFEYTLVSEMEADYAQNKISVTSPVGRGLLNHKEGEDVEINIPAGVLKYKILKISR